MPTGCVSQEAELYKRLNQVKFDIRFLEFLFRLDRPLVRPAAGLNLEPLTLNPEP